MRLLSFDKDGRLLLTEFYDDNIPQYAILSHRWEVEEVTLADVQRGIGQKLAGYHKIQFCGEQAKRDGLKYFWVDTCCIDKSNNNELAEAINSMFRWYQSAAKCYVYLSDVSRPPSPANTNANLGQSHWESEFRKSIWFTRGWTLQELIAPPQVEFYSKEGVLLGTKATLERHICDTTSVAYKALRGALLASFSVAERMSWSENRETTRREDMAYSLLGLFDISMPLIYGEGRERAFTRLREEIDKASKGESYCSSRGIQIKERNMRL